MQHIAHLSKDKLLKKVIASQKPHTIIKSNHIHLEICASIISQQLSTKVAKVIHGRFMNLFDTKYPKPSEIIKVPFDTLRGIGLSNAKTNYVINVCNFFY